MRMLLAGTVFIALFCSNSAFADCASKFKEYFKTDAMVKAVFISKDKTEIFINNIRNFKAIDIEFYGFNSSMLKSVEKSFGCRNPVLKEAFNSYGMPDVKIVEAANKGLIGKLPHEQAVIIE